MAAYLYTLLVTFDQEYAIQKLFMRHGWKLIKREPTSGDDDPTEANQGEIDRSISGHATPTRSSGRQQAGHTNTSPLQPFVKLKNLSPKNVVEKSTKAAAKASTKVTGVDSVRTNDDSYDDIADEVDDINNDYGGDTDEGDFNDNEELADQVNDIINNEDIKLETLWNDEVAGHMEDNSAAKITNKVSRASKSTPKPKTTTKRKKGRPLSISPKKYKTTLKARSVTAKTGNKAKTSASNMDSSLNSSGRLSDLDIKIETNTTDPNEELLNQLETLPGIEHYSKVFVKSIDEAKACISPPDDVNETGYSALLTCYFCSACGYTFQEEHQYLGHKRNEQCVFPCDFCEEVYSFRNYSKYETHMHTHRNQTLDDSFDEINTEFLCADCGSIFKSKGGLRKHLLGTHGIGKMKHYCNICKKSFLEKELLQSHLIMQHGSEAFKCCEPECQKEFASKSSLKRHKENFHDNKLYSCSTCHRVYNHRQILADHVKAVHTEGLSYRCKICGASFKWRASLARHMSMKHQSPYSEH